MCWYCYWGLPEPVYNIYAKYKALVGEMAMEYGPAHIVWSDNNLGDGNIKWCINECDHPSFDYERDAETVAAVRQSLVELLSVPEEIRCPPGIECDDGEEADNPPPDGMVMIRKR